MLECSKGGIPPYHDAAFAALENIRKTRESELTDYFEKLLGLTFAAESDTLLTALFKARAADDTLVSLPRILEDQIDLHFVSTYGEFYDLLWVDTAGIVFHSIRRESDYRTCLFKDSSSAQLSKSLRSIREPSFVDFENYSPSQEPGTFHVVPISQNDHLAGWLIFQQSINRINTMLIDQQNMGRTGEIYLVNSNNIMLSQSRFARESTILNRTVNTEAVKAAAESESGSLLIEDYRGVRVFSSFSHFDIMDTRWYIVAEIDETEVVTAHFRTNKAVLQQPILDMLVRNPTRVNAETYPVTSTIKVDMGEYGFSREGQQLVTRGVATCTGLAVTYPGRFAYLAHVSPTDETYSSTSLDLFEQSAKADLITRLLNRIRQYDIYPYELDSLDFTLVATHDEACWNIIDQLVDFGITLDKIKLFYKPDAVYANVRVRADAATVSVEWIVDENHSPMTQASRTTPTLGDLVKRLSS